jgi:hypothetical protein
MCELSALPESPADDIYESEGPGPLPGSSWACYCRTEYLPVVVNRSSGTRFMRIDFYCTTCKNGFTRYYDLLAGRYAPPSGRFVSQVMRSHPRARPLHAG